jgi:hypothetical protein
MQIMLSIQELKVPPVQVDDTWASWDTGMAEMEVRRKVRTVRTVRTVSCILVASEVKEVRCSCRFV